MNPAFNLERATQHYWMASSLAHGHTRLGNAQDAAVWRQTAQAWRLQRDVLAARAATKNTGDAPWTVI